MNSLVSILMPVYNHEKFVEKAILSVLNQSYNNIELIVLNDGSKDNSDLIIRNLKKIYDFTYISQSNQGLVKSLNYLKTLAKGEYLSIIASDDFIDKHKISKLVDYMENNNNYAMVYSNMYLINDNNDIVGSIKDGGKSGNIFNDLICGDFFINSITTLIRKNIYDKYNYQDLYIEDYQMWLRIALNHNIGYYDDYLSYYRVSNPNSLSSNLIKMQEAEYQIINEYKELDIFTKALNNWNIRWFSSFSKCNKSYALNHFFLKVIKKENLLRKDFYIAILKFLIPCVLYRLIK